MVWTEDWLTGSCKRKWVDRPVECIPEDCCLWLKTRRSGWKSTSKSSESGCSRGHTNVLSSVSWVVTYFLTPNSEKILYFIGECNPVTCFDHLASRTGICDASAEILGDGSPLWHSVRPAEPLLGLISTNVVPWFWSHSLRSFICTTLSKLFLKYVFQKAVICLRTTRENCIADHGQSLNEHSYLSSRGGNLIVLSLPFLSKKPNGMLPYFTEYQCLLRSLDSVRFWVKFRPTYLQLIHSLIHS